MMQLLSVSLLSSRFDKTRRKGLSLLELLACVTILAVLTMAILPRLGNGAAHARSESCRVNIRVLEVQCALWRREHGRWPNSSLSDIGSDPTFFPEGLPQCPVDGSAYNLDSNSGRIQTHNH